MVTPFDVFTLDLKHDSFDRALGAQHDLFSLFIRGYLEAQIIYVRKTNILEWLWPDQFCALTSARLKRRSSLHPPIRAPPQDDAVRVQQPRTNNDRFRHLVFPCAHWLARHYTTPELCAGIGRENDADLPSIVPIGSFQIERRDLQRSVLLIERAVGAPYVQLRRDREVRRGALVRVYLAMLASYPHCVRTELACNSIVRGLRSEKVVDYGPGGHGPTIVDLSNSRDYRVEEEEEKKKSEVTMRRNRRSPYLPYERTSRILLPRASPVPSPQAICGGERLSLHDLGVINIANCGT